MKSIITPLRIALFALTASALAVVIQPYSTWDNLLSTSPDLIIVRCTQTSLRYTVPADGTVRIMRDGLVESEIEVDFVLRGATNSEPTHVLSRRKLHQGERYLIFSTFHDGFFQAIEPYRVVPLGASFPTNLLVGKSLEEQIQLVLRYRLDQLDGELERLQEEKERLEAGLRE